MAVIEIWPCSCYVFHFIRESRKDKSPFSVLPLRLAGTAAGTPGIMRPPGVRSMARCYSADEAPVKGNADTGWASGCKDRALRGARGRQGHAGPAAERGVKSSIPAGERSGVDVGEEISGELEEAGVGHFGRQPEVGEAPADVLGGLGQGHTVQHDDF